MNNRLQDKLSRITFRAAAFITGAVLALSSAVPSFAAQGATNYGTLELQPKVGDSLVGESYNGTFAIYQVATGVETGDHVLADDFASYSGTAINQANLEDDTRCKEIAAQLVSFLEDHKEVSMYDPDGVGAYKAYTRYTLPTGLYLVTQISAGTGYHACTPFLVTLPSFGFNEDGTSYTKYDVVAYPKLSKVSTPGGGDGGHHDNPPVPVTYYGKVALGKLDAVTGKALQGVVFNLCKLDSEGKGTAIGTYTTDENGLIYVDHLSYGNYYFEEMAALEGYVLDKTPQNFTIDSEDTKRIVMTNTPIEQPVEPEENHGFTGDESNMMLYGAAAAAAAGLLVVWIVVNRRKHKG